MTPEQFNLLNNWEKDLLLIAKGVKVASVLERESEVFLCQLHDFYVEVCYITRLQIFSGLHAIAGSELPSKFLMNIDLSEILSLLE